MKTDTLSDDLLYRVTYRRRHRNFHLVQAAVDCLPQWGSLGAYLKQMTRDKLIEHKHCIDQHGEDLPERRGWKWPS